MPQQLMLKTGYNFNVSSMTLFVNNSGNHSPVINLHPIRTLKLGYKTVLFPRDRPVQHNWHGKTY